MKHYDLVPQENNIYCVCSTLQAILARHGTGISQSQIASNLTPTANGFLVGDNRIKDFLKSRGFDYFHYLHNQTPYEPEYVLNDMDNNDGIIGINTQVNHVYLLQSFDGSKVKLIDPKDATIVEREYYELLKQVGFYGLLKRLS